MERLWAADKWALPPNGLMNWSPIRRLWGDKLSEASLGRVSEDEIQLAPCPLLGVIGATDNGAQVALPRCSSELGHAPRAAIGTGHQLTSISRPASIP